MPEYIVKQGDCMESIAHKFGFFWEKIWNHSKNSKLKEKRKNPNVINPGDVVFVPDKGEKQESCTTEQRHRFRKKGVPSMLRLRLLEVDEPRANEPYTLDIDGELLSGTTDANGRIEHLIPPNVKRGMLLVGEGQEEYPLVFGHIDPVDEITGVQARLNNLGFDCGLIDGSLGSSTRYALKQFQTSYNLPVNGEIDQATQDKLTEVFGC